MELLDLAETRLADLDTPETPLDELLRRLFDPDEGEAMPVSTFSSSL